MSNISNLIYKFSDNWSSFKEDSRKKSENKSLFVIDKNKPQYLLFNYEIPNEIKKIMDDNRFIIDSSLGQTNISAIPWIAILNKEITFVIGPAGTGKTFIAVSHAVYMLTSGLVDKIIISRPAVEAGEKLGFLPGDL